MNDPSKSRHPLDQLAEEFSTRRRFGETPAIVEYADRLPGMRQQVEDLLPVVSMLEDCSRDAPTPIRLGEEGLQHLGDYTVVREIGRGGMGVVYEARQQSLDRRVALKILPTSLLTSPRQLVRFSREAQSAARLHHANIVTVHGVGCERGTHYFVMEYVDGVGLDRIVAAASALEFADPHSKAGVPDDSETITLGDPAAERIVRRLSQEEFTTQRFRARRSGEYGVLSGDPVVDDVLLQADFHRATEGCRWTNVAGIGIQVADALQSAHDQGVLHRDVKPSNLLLDANGHVWVTDFGLAKMLDADDLTESSEVVGTLRYMAPEQLAGKFSPASDVYGIGATMYELLVGRPLITEETRLGQMLQIREGSVVPPRTLVPAIPPDLATIVMKAVALDPTERYARPADLVADLRRFLYGLSLDARPPSLLERLRRWGHTHPVVTATVSVAITAVMLAAFWFGGRISRLEDEVDSLERTLESAQSELNRERARADRLEGDTPSGVDEGGGER